MKCDGGVAQSARGVDIDLTGANGRIAAVGVESSQGQNTRSRLRQAPAGNVLANRAAQTQIGSSIDRNGSVSVFDGGRPVKKNLAGIGSEQRIVNSEIAI